MSNVSQTHPILAVASTPLRWARRLYEWTLNWAQTPYGVPALVALAFLEASVFPIPPDALLAPLALARPRRALFYGMLCTIGSVAGAALGWTLGRAVWQALGVFEACPEFGGGAAIFEHIPGFHCDRFGTVQNLYERNAWLSIFSAAFTPIPFKIFTVAAGVFQIGLPTLLTASLLGRGARFMLLATLVWKLGDSFREFIERRFELLTVAFTVLLIGGFLALRLL